VLKPIRLHSAAKNYLSAVGPDYSAKLSITSDRMLSLQGSAFDAQEARPFIEQTWVKGATEVRRWDDSAKERGPATPKLAQFRAYAFATRRRIWCDASANAGCPQSSQAALQSL